MYHKYEKTTRKKRKRESKKQNTKGRTRTLGYQKTSNTETGHKEREKKNNHRITVGNKKNKTEVQEMERKKMGLLHGM